MNNKLKNSGVIPEVSDLKLNDQKYTLMYSSSISVSDRAILAQGYLLQSYLSPATGFSIPVDVNSESCIMLILEDSCETYSHGFPDESYTLDITTSKCILKAKTPEGLARSIQTLRQLFPSEILSDKVNPAMKWEVAGCQIVDKPRFGWRGMHLDVCRHFTNKKDVCKFIDLIALYKYNRFHLHLTEDQAWRIEIKKYPKLIEIGAKRDSTLIGLMDNKPKRYDDKIYSGYYTQEDIREIVTFAADRGITVVPEIDMPGHMQAAIAAYPELGCTDMSLKPLCHWGVSQHILNVEESTITFMKNVIDEVMELFPGDYIHIGGDEAPKYEWAEQRRIQDRMVELGVKDEDELQSWFISTMSSYIQSKGRKVIGWDEILDGGLAEGVAVMSWRGEEGGLEAASQGHDVVMTPESHVYFDYYQADQENEPLAIGGFTPIEKVYSYEPIPMELPEAQHKYVLGSQGHIWTEYLKEFKQVEYMAFPRVCALSEVLWIDKEKKNYRNFLNNLTIHNKKLKTLNVNFYNKN